MQADLPDVLNVLILSGGEDVRARVEAVAPGRLNIVLMSHDFDEEIAAETPGRAGRRPTGEPAHAPAERDALVREAHVVYAAFPFPRTLITRAPNLRWAHFGFAGVSNLMGTDWWGAALPVTSSRGAWNALPIAESVIAATFMFARRLDVAVRRTLAHEFGGSSSDFRGMRLLAGKTMAVVGLGGIGSHVARLARACGMRVIATRRSATARRENVDGVDLLYPASELHAMLGEADFVAVCAMWTPETQGLLDAAAFEATKPGAYLMNIARGEIIDEDALVAALESGRLAGAYLDVWYDDLLGKPPSAALQAAPNAVFTPHASGRSDVPQAYAIDLLCANLARFLAGEPLENVIDWQRGY